MTTLLEAALEYQRRGFSVVPIKPREKFPALVEWKPYQTTPATEQQVREWWTKWPRANIAVITGEVSGIVAIDLDSKEAGEQLKKLFPDLDFTKVPRAKTGRGWQTFFKHPGITLENRTAIIENVDFRGDGGYFIAAPSIHPNGKVYEWQIEIGGELPSMTQELIEFVATPTAHTQEGARTKFDTASALNGVPAGKRDDTVWKLACKLRSADVPYEMAKSLILEAANRCSPPFSEEIATEKVFRAYEKYKPNEAEYAGAVSIPEGTKLVEFMEAVEREDVDFLWTNRIARGKLTDFSGDPGIGKSTAASMIAATISRGEKLPFGKEPENSFRSLIISAEDAPADVLKPRLERMGADMSMIAIPNRALNLAPGQIDAALIDRMLTELNPALCIIDPIIAYTSGKNTNKASDVREFLGPITALAAKHHVAFIMIRHLNKNSGGSAIYRGQGSIDFAAACRSAFVFAQDQNDAERRFMSHAKSSLSKLQPTLEYYIETDGSFRWGIENDQTADQILAPGPKADKMTAAVAWLQKVLKDGPVMSSELKERAPKDGMAWRTVWRAKDEMGIKAAKEQGSGAWMWELPKSMFGHNGK